jgi:hypothetical protein
MEHLGVKIWPLLVLSCNWHSDFVNGARRHEDEWDSGDIVPRFITLVLDGGDWSTSRPPSLNTIFQKLMWASYFVWTLLGREKLVTSSNLNSQAVHHIAHIPVAMLSDMSLFPISSLLFIVITQENISVSKQWRQILRGIQFQGGEWCENYCTLSSYNDVKYLI